jgi:anti-sigma regulatory factor (Ser/Thr protein kinase)
MDQKINWQEIVPDAASTYIALRSAGYDNVSAIADLIDNSIDAGANNVRLYVESQNYGDSIEVIIADDGCGMDRDTIIQAIRIGGKKAHDNAELDLGKYGVGLIAASTSMGKKVSVYSKKDDIITVAIFDLDVIVKYNQFYADIHQATPDEEEYYNSKTESASSGTVLRIEKCDKIQSNSTNELAKEATETLRRIFRLFMKKDGKKLFVNNLEVNYDDPLWLEDPETKIFLDNKKVTFESNGVTKEMSFTVVKLPNKGTQMNKKLGFNIPNQGFYLMRNNREIASGVAFPEIFSKHNDNNFTRIEWNFSADLDDEMNINFLKHNVTPSAYILALAKQAVGESVAQIKREVKIAQNPGNAPKNPGAAPKPKPLPTPTMAPTANPTPSPNPLPQQVATEPTRSQAEIYQPITNSPINENISVSFETRFASEGDGFFEVVFTENEIQVLYNASCKLFKDTVINDANLGKNKKLLDTIIEAFIRSSIKSGFGKEQIMEVLNNTASQIISKN